MKIASATQRSQMPPCQMSCQYMQATTAGTAAMRPYVNKFGSASGRADTEIGLGVTASMNQRIPLLAPHKKPRFMTIPILAPTRPSNWTYSGADSSTGCSNFQAKDGQADMRYHRSTGTFVKKVVNFSCCLGAHAGNFSEIGRGSALNRLERPEVLQEGALAGRPDAWDFLQAGLAQVLLAAGAMRADRKPMRLVAQPLDEIEHRVARLEHERVTSGDMKCFPSGVAVRPLGHAHERYISEAKCHERLGRGGELATAAVDDHEIGPRGFGVVRNLLALDILLVCRGLHLSPKGRGRRAQRVG